MDGSNCEGPEILPYVQAKNLTSHSLKDASRRHETSGSEMKKLLFTNSNTYGITIVFPPFLYHQVL